MKKSLKNGSHFRKTLKERVHKEESVSEFPTTVRTVSGSMGFVLSSAYQSRTPQSEIWFLTDYEKNSKGSRDFPTDKTLQTADEHG